MGGTRLVGWLVGAAERDAVDWDTVYREELPRIYNFFRYRVGNPATAEDLTSLAFEKAWRARAALPSGARRRLDVDPRHRRMAAVHAHDRRRRSALHHAERGGQGGHAGHLGPGEAAPPEGGGPGPGLGPALAGSHCGRAGLGARGYFLNEDEAGKVHAEGDHKVHVLKVTANDLVLDPRFQLDFNRALASGPARPHGVAFK